MFSVQKNFEQKRSTFNTQYHLVSKLNEIKVTFKDDRYEFEVKIQ